MSNLTVILKTFHWPKNFVIISIS